MKRKTKQSLGEPSKAFGPHAFVQKVIEALLPFIDPNDHENLREDVCRKDIYLAVVPFFSEFTIADAVASHAMISTVKDSIPYGTGDRYESACAAIDILEDFICTGFAAGPECVAAMAHFATLTMDENTDEPVAGPDVFRRLLKQIAMASAIFVVVLDSPWASGSACRKVCLWQRPGWAGAAVTRNLRRYGRGPSRTWPKSAAMGATMKEYSESPIERAADQSHRVRALLMGLEASLGQDRIGSIEFDSTLRNLVDVARDETATLCKILEDRP